VPAGICRIAGASWFDPAPLDLPRDAFGPFATSRRLTTAGDVVVVGTPGHTSNHVSVIVEDDGLRYFLAGDTSYTQELMVAGQIDGVSADDGVARATLEAIGRFARDRPTVYLPTHDPESASRLASRRPVHTDTAVPGARLGAMF
jgi:N-acyl homoserine lactone hydrolase